MARRAKTGVTIATSRNIWENAPEKAFAVRAQFAEAHPNLLAAALRALLRAAKFCDLPENAAYTAAVLSRRKYLAVDSHAILATLPSGAPNDQGCAFFRGAATFPWRSHALWFLTEMRRWGLIEAGVDLYAWLHVSIVQICIAPSSVRFASRSRQSTSNRKGRTAPSGR